MAGDYDDGDLCNEGIRPQIKLNDTTVGGPRGGRHGNDIIIIYGINGGAYSWIRYSSIFRFQY